jgi:hypothetical protein
MRLLISFLLIVSFIVGCSSNTNGLDKGLYNDSKDIVKIYDDYLSGKSKEISEQDQRKIGSYLNSHPDANYKNKDLEFIHNIYDLTLKVERYRNYIKANDSDLVVKAFDDSITMVNDVKKQLNMK